MCTYTFGFVENGIGTRLAINEHYHTKKKKKHSGSTFIVCVHRIGHGKKKKRNQLRATCEHWTNHTRRSAIQFSEYHIIFSVVLRTEHQLRQRVSVLSDSGRWFVSGDKIQKIECIRNEGKNIVFFFFPLWHVLWLLTHAHRGFFFIVSLNVAAEANLCQIGPSNAKCGEEFRDACPQW